MKDYCWLIRTKQNKILGPVTKQKVIELVQSSSLTGEDEICMGNGFWFWVKEEALVDKYLFGDAKQPFNPVCEAKTLYSFKDLNNESPIVSKEQKNVEEVTETQSSDDVTKVITNFDIPKKQEVELDKSENSETEIYPETEDLDYPEIEERTSSSLPSDDPSEISLDLGSGPVLNLDAPASKPLINKVEKKQEEVVTVSDEECVLPADDDLAYPDMESDDVFEASVDLDSEPESLDKISDISIDESADKISEITKKLDEKINRLDEDNSGSMEFQVDIPEESVEESEENKIDIADLDQNIVELEATKQGKAKALDEDDLHAILKEEKNNGRKKKGDEPKNSRPSSEELTPPKKKKKKKKKKVVEAPPELTKRNDRIYLYVFALILSMILYGVFYYYTEILGKEVVKRGLELIVPTAHAQEVDSNVKKKSI